MNFITGITLPAWATTDEAKCFFYGLLMAASIRIFRAGLKWMKRIANDSESRDS